MTVVDAKVYYPPNLSSDDHGLLFVIDEDPLEGKLDYETLPNAFKRSKFGDNKDDLVLHTDKTKKQVFNDLRRIAKAHRDKIIHESYPLKINILNLLKIELKLNCNVMISTAHLEHYSEYLPSHIIQSASI